MISTRLSCVRTASLSGNAGSPNLNAMGGLLRWIIVLIVMKLRKNSLHILPPHIHRIVQKEPMKR